MNVTEVDIHQLLPQREPIVMVDRLVEIDGEKTVSETVVTADNIFTEAGVFTASGLMENIAQTCAARIGYVNKYILKQEIQLGFIGAIRNLRIYRCPAVGETIVTTIHTAEEIFGMSLVNATVSAGGSVIAEATMKIALSKVESKTGEQ